MNKILSVSAFLIFLLAFCVSCDPDDPSISDPIEVIDVQNVAPRNDLSVDQRTAIYSLLENMVKVEACQFYIGAQSRSTTRANYLSSYTVADSMKLTVSVSADGDTTIIKNNPFVDYVHLLDKRAYRHQLSNGKVRTDTIYYTTIYRMPTGTGVDNGHLWVGPVTEMSMADDYYIGRYEVTQGEWEMVMGSGKWPTGRRCIEVEANTRRDSAWYAVVGKGAEYPAYNVWYEDALAFCQKLNDLCGLSTTGNGYRFRLPTEAEWECAARGGNRCRGFYYAGSDTYSEVAWCAANAFTPGIGTEDFGMHPRGELAANELGLYDMSGNVAEWVENTYYRYTYRDSLVNATFNAARMPRHASNGYEGDTLILRGGSWYQSQTHAFGCGSRQEYTRGRNDNESLQAAIMHSGFRLVLSRHD